MDDENDNQEMTPQPGAGGPAPTVNSQPLPAASPPPDVSVPQVESKPLADTAPLKEQFPQSAPEGQLAEKAPAEPQEGYIQIPEKPAAEVAPEPTQEKAPASTFQDKVEKFRQAGFSNDEISEYTAKTGAQYLAAGFSQEEVNQYLGVKSPDITGIQKMVKANLDVQQAESENSKEFLGFPKMLDKAFGMPISDALKGGDAVKNLMFPAAVRGHLMDAYKNGTASDAGDFMQQAIPAAVETAHPTSGINNTLNKLSNFLSSTNPQTPNTVTAEATEYKGNYPELNDLSLLLSGTNHGPISEAQRKAREGFFEADKESYKKAWHRLNNLNLDEPWFKVSEETKQKAIQAQKEGKGFREVYEPAMTEAVMNSPVGKGFELMGGIPGVAEVMTGINKYGVPTVSKATGATPDELNALMIVAGGMHGGKVLGGKIKEATTSRYTTYWDVPKETTAKPMEPNAPSPEVVQDTVKAAGTAFKETAPAAKAFDDHALVMFGREGEKAGAETLRNVYKETGVKPDQVLEDAKANPEVAKDLLAGEVPKAYEQFKEPEKPAAEEPKAEEAAPPPGVQYSDLDPTSEQFDFEKELAAEHGIELQPKRTTPKTVRMYHGGEDPLSGGGRWATPDADYAKSFRGNGDNNQMHYVDVAEDHPSLRKAYDDTGLEQKAPFVSTELPEELAKQMKPLSPHAEENASLGLGDDQIPFRRGDDKAGSTQGMTEVVPDQLYGKELPVDMPEAQRSVVEAMQKEVDRLAPQSKLRVYDALRTEDGVGIHGAVLKDIIYASLEDAKSGVTTVRHEAIHSLKRMDLITKDEWASLEKAAEEGGWLRKHDIEARYAGEDRAQHLEEAVAEEFSKYKAGEKTQSAEVQGIFQKIQDFFTAIADHFRKIFGNPNLTADEIFAKIESGEVGRREAEAPHGEEDMAFQRKSPEEIIETMKGSPDEFQRYAAARHALSEALRGKKPTMPIDLAREIVSMDRYKYEPIFKELRRAEEKSKAREELSKEGASASMNPLIKILNPSNISESAKDMATSLRQARGPQAQTGAIIEKSLEKYAKDIKKLSDPERLQLIDYMESRTLGAKVPDPKLQELADKIRNIYAQMAVKVQEVFPDVGLRQDYFTHQYKDPVAAEKFFSEWIAKQGSERNLRQRAFPTLKEAMEAGLEPKTTNPIETVMTYVNNMNNLISTHEAVRIARENGIAEYFRQGAQPEGWEPLKGNLAEKDGKYLYAPEDAARVYNNDISEKATGPAGEILDNIQRGSNFATKLVLGLSGYHATAVTIASMAKDVTRAVFASSVKDAAADLASAVTPLKNTLEGGKIIDAYLGRSELPPELQKALDLAVKNNTIHVKQQDYWKSGPAKDFIDAFKGGTLLEDAKAAGEKMITGRTLAENPLTGTAKVIASGLGKTMDTLTKPLFDTYIPRLKISANIHELHDWIEQHPKATPKELDRAAQDIGNNIDNTFGEMMRDNLFWHQMLRQGMQTTFLSYSWIVGGARMLKGIPDVGMTLIGKKKGLTSNAKYLFGMAMTYAVINGVRTYLGTGQAPDSYKDFIYPRTGGTTIQGKPERELLPGHIGQYTHYLHEGLAAAGNELSPALKMLYNLVSNSDFRGLPITNANNTWFDTQRWGDYGKYVLHELSPLQIKTFLQGQKKGSKISTFESAIGARQAPQFVTDPEGTEAMMKKVHNREYKRKLKSDKKLEAQYKTDDSEE